MVMDKFKKCLRAIKNLLKSNKLQTPFKNINYFNEVEFYIQSKS